MAIRAPLPFFYDNASAMEWTNGGTLLPFPSSSSSSSFQHQLVQQQQQQLVGSIPVANTCYPNCVATPPMDLSCSLATLVEKERQEIDQFLRLQSVRLRAKLVRRTSQREAALLAALESKGLALLRRKDAELAEARKRSAELEELIGSAAGMRDTWQRAAREQEAEAVALGSALERLAQPSSSAAASCSDDVARRGGGGARSCWHPCRSCGYRDSCVLLMPCRHLCACKRCAGLLVSCPVCGSAKSDSLEVLLAWELNE